MTRIADVDEVDIGSKKVLVRVDLNSPVDPENKKIIDDSRIRLHSSTIRYLVERGAGVVVMSHQGRPGDRDFVDLSQHAALLEKYSGVPVRFVEDVIGPTALKEVRDLRPGEVVMLDNVRFLAEELLEAPPEVQARTFLVRKIAPLVDYYVNDAFASAHRSQPSIVGFPPVVRSCAGPIMMKEIKALSKISGETEPPKVFVMGGAKVLDSLRVIENITKNRIADRILTAGLLGLVFQVAKGVKAGQEVVRSLESRGLLSLIPRARKIIMQGAPIETPIDYRVLKENGEIVNEPPYVLRGAPLDIGDETIEMYSSIMKEANLIVMRGPAGYIEDPRFLAGTKKLVEAAAQSKAYVIIGGGHLSMFAQELSASHGERIHVSSGGGALLEFLSGIELPALSALKISYSKFWEGGRK
ncbi:MAG: phosphoglycerate kinase [Desulfurococcaceae archaeon]